MAEDHEAKGGVRCKELKRADGVSSGGEVEVPIVVSWTDEGDGGNSSKISFQTIVHLSREEAMRHLRLKPGEAKNRLALLKAFGNSVAGRFKTAIEERGEGKAVRVTGKVAAEDFEEILEMLARKGLIVEAETPKYVKQRMKYWRLA